MVDTDVCAPPLRELLERPRGRRRLVREGSGWGALYLPAPGEAAPRPDRALRLVAMTSFTVGRAALRAMAHYQRRHPDAVSLVGVVTDDPLDPAARIGRRKRAWKYLSEEGAAALHCSTLEAGLTAGAPVFTGEIKAPWFRRLLEEWRPDALVCCCLGQVIDRTIVEAADVGAYNLHPSDLGRGHGAGFAPHEDAFARQAFTARWTLHRITDVLDGGPVVGVSPPVYIRDAFGSLPATPLAYYERMNAALPGLARQLLDALVARHRLGLRRPLEELRFSAATPLALLAELLRPLRGPEERQIAGGRQPS